MESKTDIWVYAHWKGMPEPLLMGILSVQQAKGREAFSFSYQEDWLSSREQCLLDPDISWFGGKQFPNRKSNFGMFLDSMPDTWGRTLMKRRAAILANQEDKRNRILHDIDYLLGVHDPGRMGALRFKTDPLGDFLDNNPLSPTPPWSSIRTLQHAAGFIESNEENEESIKWITMLMAPGSSLGGARPKANIIDQHGALWIAKFPSKNDTINKGSWEYLAYRLATNAGIHMADCKIEQVYGNYHTFFTKRFDRDKSDRIHFASAMTMTGKNEELIRDETASYLDLVEFIQYSCQNVTENLHQLWRRIIFNIMISNTDDHLRNHGFLLSEEGWQLSPAYDLNPSVDKAGLSLNIDMDNNSLDFGLAKSVGKYFRLSEKEMNSIMEEVKSSVADWQKIAQEISIPRNEQTLMSAAFNLP